MHIHMHYVNRFLPPIPYIYTGPVTDVPPGDGLDVVFGRVPHQRVKWANIHIQTHSLPLVGIASAYTLARPELM